MKTNVTFCFLLFSSFHAYPRYNAPFTANSSNYDIVYHRISLTVNPGNSAAISNGSITTYFKTTIDNVSSIQFDLDGALTVSSAVYHGAAVAFNHNKTTAGLTTTISAISTAGTFDSVKVNYNGTPTSPKTSIPNGYNYQLHSGQYSIFTLDEA